MRVITGSAKGMRLCTLDGLKTRPTTDRIKETLFNMIAPWVADCRFLDLFAGSGGIGIEALSRGAKKAVFVENNFRAASCIRQNLAYTKLEDKAEVMCCDVMEALGRMDGQVQFDYIFMDPPYNQGWEKEVLYRLSRTRLIAEGGVVIAEASLKTEFRYLEYLGFSLIKEKCYKTNKHVFIERSEGGRHHESNLSGKF